MKPCQRWYAELPRLGFSITESWCSVQIRSLSRATALPDLRKSRNFRLQSSVVEFQIIGKRVDELMDTVGLAKRFANSYPHELDGGRRQRIGIARALSMRPKFIVCDEPVSALDVSIQAQILNLLQDLQEQMGIAYIFITHDLSVVKHISDEICVMYLGQVVEKCATKELFNNTLHPYTQALLSAIPVPSLHNRRKKILLKGELSSPIDPKPGCRFAARCIYATEECHKSTPKLREACPGHFAACHHIGNMGET